MRKHIVKLTPLIVEATTKTEQMALMPCEGASMAQAANDFEWRMRA
jgi:hypothetical protein